MQIEDIVVEKSDGISEGIVENSEKAAASIKKAIGRIEENLGITVTEAYAGISGRHIRCAKHPYYVYVASQNKEITAGDVKKLNDEMRNVQAPDGYELMHIIPQHYMVSDSDETKEVKDPKGHFGDTLESTFNLIIGDKKCISRLNNAFEKVGVSQLNLFINALTMAEAVTYPDEKEVGVAVVDLGAGTSDICIFHDGIVRNISVIPIGADSINRDIRSYGIMERYVEELKTEHGYAVAAMADEEILIKTPGRTPNNTKDITSRNLAQIIEARMLDIIDYILEEIKEAGYEGRLDAGIVLTGGGANLKEIKTLFEGRTGLEIRVAAPDIKVNGESKHKADDPRYSVAIGTLWQALNSETGKPRKGREHATLNDRFAAQGQQGGVQSHDINWGEPVEKPKREKREKKQAKRKNDDFTDGQPMDDEQVTATKAPKKDGFFSRLKKQIDTIGNTLADYDPIDDTDITK